MEIEIKTDGTKTSEIIKTSDNIKIKDTNKTDNSTKTVDYKQESKQESNQESKLSDTKQESKLSETKDKVPKRKKTTIATSPITPIQPTSTSLESMSNKSRSSNSRGPINEISSDEKINFIDITTSPTPIQSSSPHKNSNIHGKRKHDDNEIAKDDNKDKKVQSKSITSFFSKQNGGTCNCKAEANAELEATNSKLLTDIETLTHQNNKLNSEISAIQADYAKARTTLQTQYQALESLTRENAMNAARLRRERLFRDDAAIGRMTLIYEGMGRPMDHWEEGTRGQELQRRKERINQERESIEEEKRLFKKKSKKADDKDSDGFKKPFEVDEYSAEMDEVNKIRLLNLKKQEKEVADLETELVLARILHVRFSKNLRDENLSIYQNHPVLKQRYLIVQLLGKGGFGEVHKAYDLLNCKYVACKIHSLNPQWNDAKKENYVRHSSREYAIHKKLDHPHVVRLFDVFEIDKHSFCTVMDFCDDEDLDHLLKLNGTINEREAKCIILQVYSGLKYFNEKGNAIIHYDLKPGNILFHKGQVKITDFGLSKVMDQNHSLELTSQGAGTLWYLPPEVYQTPAPKISSKVDVWSLGVIFYQILFGKRPFGDDQNQEIFLSHHHNLHSNLEFPAKPSVSDQAKDFIRLCLTPNHLERCTVLELQQKSPYLKF